MLSGKSCLKLRLTTCLENLAVSGNLTAVSVSEMSGSLLKVREVSWKHYNLVREKLPKTVYCKLHICVHTGI